MTDHLTQKDRRALGLPRDDVPRWVALAKLTQRICTVLFIGVLVIGLIRAATQ